MPTLLRDLRYAFRNLRNARGFALVAAVTLAIGIGANTAIFSIIDAVLLRPLPYRNSSQLVRLNETESAPGRYLVSDRLLCRTIAGRVVLLFLAEPQPQRHMYAVGWNRRYR
jgi:hypothetical protein